MKNIKYIFKIEYINYNCVFHYLIKPIQYKNYANISKFFKAQIKKSKQLYIKICKKCNCIYNCKSNSNYC